MEAYRTLIETAYQNAENHISKINNEIINMEGMSGTKTRHFYNNVLNTKDARYLEIGTWKGSSVCSAMYGNKAKVICIDNWSEFGGPKNEFLVNFEKFKGENDANFIEKDCFQVDISTLPKFNIYMYDGNHSNESHYKALLHYYDCLDDVFIFIVDDWNWKDVRDGTFDSFRKLNLNVLYEKEIRLTSDNSTTLEPELSKTWWNGIYIAVLHKPGDLVAESNGVPFEFFNDIKKKKGIRETLKINYHRNSSELCEIGRKYDTDKSSQRDNVTDLRHCHPYTLFYDGLFRNKKEEPLKIAELGILDGGSLRMWQEYFTHAEIYGFEYNNYLIQHFKQRFNNDRITLANIDVTNKDSIMHAFRELNQLYDIIIEDTTHQMDDQIRVIENAYHYLKPGGIMIIEDIYKSYNESDYIDRLKPILSKFQDYYFVELDSIHKNSTGWNNDKLFILVKGGDEPIFKNTNKMTIITPSYRIENVLKLKDSINFDYVDEWIIVYDGSKILENPRLFDHPKIKEYVHTSEGISGNPQRNYALNQITNPDTLLYYLDDDNIIHPDLYKLMDMVDNTKFYTFNQTNGIKGNNIQVNGIDTAMVLLPYNLCKNSTWILDKYNADGFYMEECYHKNRNLHVFVDNDLCYYNQLSTDTPPTI